MFACVHNCGNRKQIFGKIVFNYLAVCRKSWSGGLPPVNFFEVMPFRMTENAPFAEWSVAFFIIDLHAKMKILAPFLSFIEF